MSLPRPGHQSVSGLTTANQRTVLCTLTNQRHMCRERVTDWSPHYADRFIRLGNFLLVNHESNGPKLEWWREESSVELMRKEIYLNSTLKQAWAVIGEKLFGYLISGPFHPEARVVWAPSNLAYPATVTVCNNDIVMCYEPMYEPSSRYSHNNPWSLTCSASSF